MTTKKTRLTIASILLPLLLSSTLLSANPNYNSLEKKIEIKKQELQNDLEKYRSSIRNDDMNKKRAYEDKIHQDYVELLELKKELESNS